MPQQENPGFCPTCNTQTTFIAETPNFRDHYLCTNCRSLPRERALMHVIQRLYPNWQDLRIHESSPVARGASARLMQHCKHYQPTQFWPHIVPGKTHNGVRCENLEAMTFADESIDLHITQDVFEHLFDPYKAFAEIARTLKPGGAHLCTIPLVARESPSTRRARRKSNGTIEHLRPAQYHGNPVSEDGALVTIDWGLDVGRHIFKACGLFTQVFVIDDPGMGIRADLIEVLATIKPSPMMNIHPL